MKRAKVVMRPSIHIKSPYVADIDIDGQQSLAHTASLGCNGHIDAGAIVYVFDTMSQNKCRYRVCMAELLDVSEKKDLKNAVLVGTHPKYAEDMAEQMLLRNDIDILRNVRSYIREFTICLPAYSLDSRFDFSGIDENGTPFLMEIKTVPLADYEDIPAKERKKKVEANAYADIDYREKIAYFPDGYRKKKSDPVSPRALKHVRELHRIRNMSTTRCILCFVIQRDDVVAFTPSVVDPEYREAVAQAIDGGVEVIAIAVKWTVSDDGIGEARFVKRVPVKM